jgi:hypothetical protein
MKITVQLLKFLVAVLSFVFMVGVGALRLCFAMVAALAQDAPADSSPDAMSDLEPGVYNSNLSITGCEEIFYNPRTGEPN